MRTLTNLGVRLLSNHSEHRIKLRFLRGNGRSGGTALSVIFQRQTLSNLAKKHVLPQSGRGTLSNPKIFVAVTGGRTYRNYDHVKRVLDEERPGVVVQGECPHGGADQLAKRWCEENGVPCIGVEALWDYYGNSAGPIRNGWMLDLLPIYKLIAFPGNRGTANAVKQAYAREILVRDERAAQGTPTRRAETTGSVAEGDGGPVAKPCAQKDAPTTIGGPDE